MSPSPAGPPAPPPGDPPREFGPYSILGQLGAGGTASAYLALDQRLGRRVVLKVLAPADGGLRERFLQEARAAARLDHRNLCHVYDAGEVNGTPYLTMHFVEGRPLDKALGDFAAQPRRALVLVEKVARALAHAHAHGVVHRDLKPANILLDPQGEPVVVDLGPAACPGDGDTRLTDAGDVTGAAAYVAPERYGDRRAEDGPRADVYALGAILYELLTGRRPFRGASADVQRQKRAEEFMPPTAARPGMDARLDALCRRAMAADPGQRLAGMEDFARDLTALLTTAAPASAYPPSAALTLPAAEPRVAEEVLGLLRSWGWEEGVRKIGERILLTEGERERGLLRLAAGFLRGQVGNFAEAADHYDKAAGVPELAPWAAVGAAFAAYRQKDAARAAELLAAAEAGDPRDTALSAAVKHLRGTLRLKAGDIDKALPLLFEAAELYGPEHPGSGRVLDTLGMAYAARGDFALALAFYERGLTVKAVHDDRPGLGVSYGQLGRLHLEWGDYAAARDYFDKDLRAAWSINDLFGATQVYNHLGQVELARGQPARALGFLDESVTRAAARGYAVLEAYSRKDRALARLALGRPDDAEADARRAEELFREKDFPEGVFHARRALARVAAARGRRDEAEGLLRGAAAFFAGLPDRAAAARAWSELADVQRRAGAADSLVAESLWQALDQAERSRREAVIEAVERDLAAVDPLGLVRREYERARGRCIPDDISTRTAGRQETASLLFLDLRNSTEFTRSEDTVVVHRTLNQIWAELEPVLETYEVVVNQYLGDGFMALARGTGHDRRAVAAALGMLGAVEGFNRPRRLLGMRPIEVRVGVSRGSVFFANVGTYRKIDFTAVGPATNEAARLQAVAEPGSACVSGTTWNQVKGAFLARDDAGRDVPLKGFGTGPVKVWDVVAKR